MTSVGLAVDIAVAHIGDRKATARITELLTDLHGSEYEFAIRHVRGSATLYPVPGRLTACFLMEAQGAGLSMFQGDLVRCPDAGFPARAVGDDLSEVTERRWHPVQAGDTVCIDDRARSMANLSGDLAWFEVSMPVTDYVAPRLTLLRNLKDQPGGCAAHAGAFRREALPPVRPVAADLDQRGVNRINMHALDMRTDRDPPPSPHCHGPVAAGDAGFVNHSETALVLPRSLYGLPSHGAGLPEQVEMYPCIADPLGEPAVVPVRPGSIVVTPGARGRTMGHCFVNAFAMLVAIPGFVSPHHGLPRA